MPPTFAKQYIKQAKTGNTFFVQKMSGNNAGGITLTSSTENNSIFIDDNAVAIYNTGVANVVIQSATSVDVTSVGFSVDSSSDVSINASATAQLKYGGSVVVDWGTKVLKDSVSLVSVDWESRELKTTGGNLVSVDWENRTLYDGGGDDVLNWNNKTLIDTLSVDSLNWENRTLLDAGNNPVLAWGSYNLVDPSGKVALVWNVRELQDNVENDSVLWHQRHLIDSSGISISVNWESRVLSSTGTTSLDWQNGQLSGATGVTLKWADSKLTVSGNTSVDWLNKEMKDNAVFTSLNWNSKLLKVAGGTVVDWANQEMYDSNVYFASLNWNQRLLKANDGSTTVLDWSSQQTTAVGGATLVSNAGTALTSTDTFDGYTLAQVVKAMRNYGLLQ